MSPLIQTLIMSVLGITTITGTRVAVLRSAKPVPAKVAPRPR